jgi:hypothetical protein
VSLDRKRYLHLKYHGFCFSKNGKQFIGFANRTETSTTAQEITGEESTL